MTNDSNSQEASPRPRHPPCLLTLEDTEHTHPDRPQASPQHKPGSLCMPPHNRSTQVSKFQKCSRQPRAGSGWARRLDSLPHLSNPIARPALHGVAWIHLGGVCKGPPGLTVSTRRTGLLPPREDVLSRPQQLFSLPLKTTASVPPLEGSGVYSSV